MKSLKETRLKNLLRSLDNDNSVGFYHLVKYDLSGKSQLQKFLRKESYYNLKNILLHQIWFEGLSQLSADQRRFVDLLYSQYNYKYSLHLEINVSNDSAPKIEMEVVGRNIFSIIKVPLVNNKVFKTPTISEPVSHTLDDYISLLLEQITESSGQIAEEVREKAQLIASLLTTTSIKNCPTVKGFVEDTKVVFERLISFLYPTASNPHKTYSVFVIPGYEGNGKEFTSGGVAIIYNPRTKLNKHLKSKISEIEKLCALWSNIETTDALLKQAYSHARKVANISILVDSFSHNIAAHSLVALSKYFASRKAMLENENILITAPFNKNISIIPNRIAENITVPMVIDKEYVSLSDIFKLNVDKNDNVSELKKAILSLYQETSSEEICLPVPLDDSLVTFIDYLQEKAELWSALIAGETFNHSIDNAYDLLMGFANNPLFVGTLAASEELNRVKFIVNGQNFVLVDMSLINTYDQYKANYDFVKRLDGYWNLKDSLAKMKIWLPGGNVGRHSVYTIFENCIRNIKHYNTVAIKLHKNEIRFHINIYPEDVNYKYCLTMYLGHTEYIDKNKPTAVINNIKNKIEKGTFDRELNRPIMGGTSQSILCAEQLVTGKFESELEDPARVFDVKLHGNFIAYTFMLWQGNEVGYFSKKNKLNNYTTSKSKLCVVDPVYYKEEAPFKTDIIRIVEGNEDLDLQELNDTWLRLWLGEDKYNRGLSLNFGGQKYYIGDNPQNRIEFDHGMANVRRLHFRNHGVFQNSLKKQWKDSQYDIMESMLTGVYAVDDRLHNIWCHKKNITKCEKKLNLIIKGESNEGALNCKEVKLLGDELHIDKNINFLVIHLSFIEKYYLDYKEDINPFIEKVKVAINDRINFQLIITTGRGRSEWLNSINQEFRSFVKYRSVYSMQKALSNAVMMDDDFDAKYNLVKVLFGS